MPIYEVEVEDGTVYEVETEDAPVEAPIASQPDPTEDAGFLETASMVPLKGISSLGRGFGGLIEMAGDATGIDFLKNQGQQFVNEADVVDQKIRQTLGLEEDDGMNTFLNIGGEVASALAPMGAAAKFGKVGKLGLAALPSIPGIGTRYEGLQDKGASNLQAGMGAIAMAPVDTALNMFDAGQLTKAVPEAIQGAMPLAREYLKRAGIIGSVNAAQNSAGVVANAVSDNLIAGQPWTPEELKSGLYTGALTGLATGPVLGAMSMSNRGGVAEGPPVEDAYSIFQRDMAEAPPPPQLALPGRGQLLGLPAPENAGALPMPEGIFGEGFQARDPNYSWLPDNGPVKTSLPEATLIDGAPIQDSPPILPSALPQSDGVMPVEAGMGPRSDAEVREAINLREGATKLEAPLYDADGALVGEQKAAPTIYKPYTTKGTLRQDLQPQEREIVSYIEASTNAKKAAQAAEKAEGIAVAPAERKAAEVASKQAEKQSQITFSPESATFAESPIARLPEPPQPQTNVIQLEQPVDMAPQPGGPIPQSLAGVDLPTYEIPVNSLRLSAEVPNWKSDADERGIVKELQGSFDRRGGQPIAVWERLDGSLEIISGRHRWDLAKRSGERTIPSQIFRESEGFTARDAAVLDAELNIRDGYGKIKDFANYFKHSGLTEEQAAARSLLNSDKGVLGFDIGTKASPSVYGLWSEGSLTDRQAAAIARAAPGIDDVQEAGIRLARAGEPIPVIEDALRSYGEAKASLPQSEQIGMFGDDRLQQLITEQARVKFELERDLQRQIKAVKNAAKDPANAAKMGLPVDDPQAILTRVTGLEGRLEQLGNWRRDPALKAQIEAEAIKRLDEGPGRRLARRKSAEGEKGYVLNPMDTLQAIRDYFIPRLPDDYNDIPDRLKGYWDSRWKRNVEWITTLQRKVPEASRAVEAGFKFHSDLSALQYDSRQLLKDYAALPDISKKRVDATATALRALRAQGRSVDFSPDALAQRYNLTPDEVKGITAVRTHYNWWHEQLRRDALDSVSHKFNMKAQEAHKTISDSVELTAKIGELEREYRKQLKDVGLRFDAMQDAFYVPYNRYGEHWAKVYDKEGKLLDARQFESVKELNAFRANATQKLGYRVETGRLRKERLTKYDGIPADILAAMDVETDGIPISDFRKHLTEAKLIPGFDPDLTRANAEYALGASRMIAMARYERALEKEFATSLAGREYVPIVKKLTALRDAQTKISSPLFRRMNTAVNTWFIGGNLRSPAADIIGRTQLQVPALVPYVGLTKAPGYALKALKTEFDYYRGAIPKGSDLDKAIEEATRRGAITGSNVSRDMFRESKGGATRLDKAHDLYFTLKSMSEKASDLGGFITGWQVYPEAIKKLRAQGKPLLTRSQFAEQFTRETRAVPTMAELPPGFRNELFRTTTKYKLYQAKIAKTMLDAVADREYKKLVAHGLMAMATGGVAGLPIAATVMVGVRAAGFEPEILVREQLPEDLADIAMYGLVSKATGIDWSSAVGFGEILPGIGNGIASGLYKGTLGIIGAPAEAIDKAYNFEDRGRTLKAVASIPFMPQLASNALSLADMYQRGLVSMTGDSVIPKKDLGIATPLAKLGGLTTLEARKAYVRQNIRTQAERRDQSFYPQRIADAEFRGDYDEADRLLEEARAKGIEPDRDTIRNRIKRLEGDKEASLSRIPEEKRKEVDDRLNRFFRAYRERD